MSAISEEDSLRDLSLSVMVYLRGKGTKYEFFILQRT
jgi:hypothetical protein